MTSVFTESSEKVNHRMAWVAAAIPVFYYLWVVWHNTVNVPYFDDFFWAYDFVHAYEKTGSWSERATLVFEQHNQHRIVPFKLLLAFLHHAFGHLDFKLISLLGNVSVLGLGVVFAILIRKIGLSAWYFVPVAFLWFQFQYFHNSILSYGIPNVSVIFFGILSFYFAASQRKKYYVALSLFFGSLAMFSNGNGLLVLPITALIFLSVKQWKTFGLVYALFVLLLGLYFLNFRMDYSEVQINFYAFQYFVNFLGATLNAQNSTLAFVFTLLLLIFNLHWLVSSRNDNRFAFLLLKGILLFVLGTAAMTALVRAIHHIDIPSWYKNYSTLFLMLSLIILYIRAKERRRVLLAAYPVSILFWAVSNYLYRPSIEELSSSLQADLYNFKNNGYWTFLPAQIGLENYENYNDLSRSLHEKELYRPHSRLAPSLHHGISPQKLESLELVREEQTDRTHVRLKSSEVNESSKPSEKYGVLRSENTGRTYFFGVKEIAVNPLKKIRNSPETYLTYTIDSRYFTSALPEDHYKPGLVIFNKKGDAKWFLADTLHYVANW